MTKKSFVKVFYEAMDELEVDAKKVGMTLTSLCRDTDISRATPGRWRREIPTTVQLVDRMQKVVRRKEAELAGTAPAPQPSEELKKEL